MFLVLILTISTARLWGAPAGALALVTLGLTWVERGAPPRTRVCVIALEALWRILPDSAFRRAVRAARGAAFVALALVAIPFMVHQARVAIYPALEFFPPGLSGSGGLGAVISEGEEAFYAARKSAKTEYDLGEMVEPSIQDASLLKQDPQAIVQTGPGLPDWTWRAVSLQWRGPVERTQRLRLVLIPPMVNSFLMFLRVGLVLAFALLILGPPAGTSWRGLLAGLRSRGSGAVVLAALALTAAPAAAADDFPSAELLDDLRKRLLEKPTCLPECASIPRLHLEVSSDSLRASLEVLVAAETAVPLPVVADGWPDRVQIDGGPAGLLRDADGTLWVQAGRGSHTVLMDGRLPDRDSIEIPLPMRPRRATARAPGWQIIGLQPDGFPDGTIQLVRDRPRDSERALEPTAVPPFVRLEREITIGLRWQTRTRVVRMTPPGTAIVLEVPMLAGESVTTADLRVKDGLALVSLGPTDTEIAWDAALLETPEIVLQAPEAARLTEVWRLAVGSMWHVEIDGIPIVHRPEDGAVRIREWRPWPGETVTVRISRPEGIPGRTLTIESTFLRVFPGLRATDASLTLNTRSSRGGDFIITLPEGAVLQSVSIGGKVPIRQEDRSVTLPIAPGLQKTEISWREPRGIGTVFRSSDVHLGETSVNGSVDVNMPADRWTLFVGGPRLGPAVNFWSFVFVSLLVSLALGASGYTPLRAHHWFLLSLGLTQSPLSLSLVVAAWLFALGTRKRWGGNATTLGFNVIQVLLVALTFAALAGLFWSVKRGLLGLPEMQISGNGSTAQTLSWFQDRSDETLPRPWALSVPLLFYRLAMLSWSLWLSIMLLRWLRWGWECFSEGGLWQRLGRPGPGSLSIDPAKEESP